APPGRYDRSDDGRSRRPRRAGRLGLARCRPVRILPERPDHDRGRPAEGDPQTDGRRRRAIDGREPLPLRDLRAYPRGDQDRVRTAEVAAMRRNLQAKTDPGWNRRAFLKVSAAATGGLLVSLYLDRPALAQEAAAAPVSKVYPPDAFVHIRPDGTIVIQVNRLEFGQ